MIKAFCHSCQKETLTACWPLQCGHIANACQECGTNRLGNPYISRKKYAKLIQLKLIPITGTPFKGGNYDTDHR